MKITKWLLIFLPTLSYAHCPIPFETDNQSFCAEIEWLSGERKVQGQFESVNYKSPQLNLRGEIPQKWVYSKMNIHVWEKGDHSHVPKFLKDFRVFPYMFMENGHHHSASYDFRWDSDEQVYILKGIGFQEMNGCWSLRWTTSEQDQLSSSHIFQTVDRFENLNERENDLIVKACQSLGESDSGHGHGNGHNHGH